VSFLFSAGPILTLKRKNILVEQEQSIGKGIFCLAFVPTNYTTSIIGNTQLAGIQTSFDTSVGYMGFGPSTCGIPEDSHVCHRHWPLKNIGLYLCISSRFLPLRKLSL
jgi:hypothetical protein